MSRPAGAGTNGVVVVDYGTQPWPNLRLAPRSAGGDHGGRVRRAHRPRGLKTLLVNLPPATAVTVSLSSAITPGPGGDGARGPAVQPLAPIGQVGISARARS